MATAQQKKKATTKSKPASKSPAKSVSKNASPKKVSVAKSIKKPQKAAVKSKPSTKDSPKKSAEPLKKVKTTSSKSTSPSSKKGSPSKPKVATANKATASNSKGKTLPSKGKKAIAPAKKNTPASSKPKTATGSSKSTQSPKAAELKSNSKVATTHSPSVKAKPAQAPVNSPGGKASSGKSVKKPALAPVNSSGNKTEKKSVKNKAVPVKGTTVEKKSKGDAPEPLQVKAEKAIREMEETMDLSKLRPRIQAGSAAPKPLPKHAPAPPLKLSEPTNTLKNKFQLEFEFRSSPKILFTSLSDSSGLAGWFADEVHTKDNIYTFIWEGGESQAKLLAIRDLQLVRFQWLDDVADGTYFQFEIKEDDITTDIALVITDFAMPGEKDTNIRLWESQVQKLRMLLGSL